MVSDFHVLFKKPSLPRSHEGSACLPELCISRSGAGPTGCVCLAGARWGPVLCSRPLIPAVLYQVQSPSFLAAPPPPPSRQCLCVCLSPDTWLREGTVGVVLMINFFQVSFSKLLERLRLHKSKDPNLFCGPHPGRGWCLAH